MRKIRQILLTEYIGAIVIGFLLAQALAATISTLVQVISFYLSSRGRAGSVFGGRSGFELTAIVPPAISVLLELLTAFLLLWWLYWDRETETPVRLEEPERPESQA